MSAVPAIVSNWIPARAVAERLGIDVGSLWRFNKHIRAACEHRLTRADRGEDPRGGGWSYLAEDVERLARIKAIGLGTREACLVMVALEKGAIP